ncbi:Nucleotide-binding universal stress protein, UspA family [Rhizobiales bacterium GAS113]|nr:Nucleotide-binding universal stress protein, UspA family [Rhizobiales bacterium GAS113]
MIKDVMVCLEGTADDDVRLAAVETIAGVFNSHVTGLFLNTLPTMMPVDANGPGANLLEEARVLGDGVEMALAKRLTRLNRPTEIHRIDVLADDIANIASREARGADTFVALRPNGTPQEPERLVEGVLFGSGRHLFLIPDGKAPTSPFDRILVAWNGSRESARALAEAMPYLYKSKAATVVVVDEEHPAELQALIGTDAINHLQHHGIDASLRRVRDRKHDVAAALIEEAERLEVDLMVMGGYGHSRLREMLLGGVTHDLLHQAPVPLIIAH